jgi:hypothetical protein
MSKVVPDTYTVEFGNRVRDSFIELGHFAEKTDFRLFHLEKHLGELTAEVRRLNNKSRKLSLKKVVVVGGTVYAGMVIGRKMAIRANRDNLKKAYSDLAQKLQDGTLKDHLTDAAADKIEKTLYGDEAKTAPGQKDQYVDEVLRGTPNAEGRLNQN